MRHIRRHLIACRSAATSGWAFPPTVLPVVTLVGGRLRACWRPTDSSLRQKWHQKEAAKPSRDRMPMADIESPRLPSSPSVCVRLFASSSRLPVMGPALTTAVSNAITSYRKPSADKNAPPEEPKLANHPRHHDYDAAMRARHQRDAAALDAKIPPPRRS